MSLPATSARVDVPYVSTFSAVDADDSSESLVWSLLDGPAGMTLSAAGVPAWTPALGQIGSQPVTVEVSDGSSADRQVYSVDVRLNAAPVFTDASTPFLCVGEDTDVQLSATDADGDAIRYGVTDGGLGVAVEPATGEVTFTATASQVGTDLISFSASDPFAGQASIAGVVSGYSSSASVNNVVEAGGADGGEDDQISTAVSPDGGVWVAWRHRTVTFSPTTIHVARLSGVGGCRESSVQVGPAIEGWTALEPVIAPNGDGAYVAWREVDPTGAISHVRVTQLAESGVPTWALPARPTTDGATFETNVAIASDASPGVYVSWLQETPTFDPRFQKLDPFGDPFWGATGTSHTGITAERRALAPFGDGGAIACHRQGAEADCRRLGSTGADMGGVASGFGPGSAPTYTATHGVASAAANGWFVMSEGTDNVGSPVKFIGLSRITTGMSRQWDVYRMVPSAQAIGVASRGPVVAADSAGAALATWVANGSVMVEKLALADGASVWSKNLGSGLSPTVATDGTFVVVSWVTGGQVRVQRFNAAGTELWAAGGVVAVSFAGTDESVIGVSQSRAITVWNDNRDGLHDVFAAAVRTDGSLGD